MGARRFLPLALVLCAGCGIHRGLVVPPPGVSLERRITLNGHPLSVHIADRRVRDGSPLLIYTTGDRGWAGKDLDVYRHLVGWGYTVAGVDAHDYVHHLDAEATTPGKLARDYEVIIATARDTLHLAADVPVILVGVSRGAGLSVVAAGQRGLRAELSGIVAVGLTKEEEYVRWYRRIGRPRADRTRVMVEVYEYLPRLGTLPITVIQSTHDNYLPAGSARELFGADTDRRRLIPIESRNHSFSDARPQLYDALEVALATIRRIGRNPQ